MKIRIAALCLILGIIGTACVELQNANVPVAPAEIKDIKAYCLDFNWGGAGSLQNRDPGGVEGRHRAVRFCQTS